VGANGLLGVAVAAAIIEGGASALKTCRMSNAGRPTPNAGRPSRRARDSWGLAGGLRNSALGVGYWTSRAVPMVRGFHRFRVPAPGWAYLTAVDG
jgi:hypothetical protein